MITKRTLSILPWVTIFFTLSSCLGPESKSSLYGSRGPASEEVRLLERALQHPTSAVIRKAASGKDYLKGQREALESIRHDHSLESSTLFGHQLSPKEKASIFHQQDLFSAYLNNPPFAQSLRDLGFDEEAYLSGSYESDLGKLKSYQALFTEKSAKGDLFYLFIQGKGPEKSLKELYVALDEMNEPRLPFLNPQMKVSEVRQAFKDYPILKGFLHELPGMIDAVLAYELNLITSEEFRAQIHVNLFHCGPSAGYWQFLKGNLIPQSFERKNQKLLFKKVFKGGLFMKGDRHNLYYGAPSTFESFVSTLFDRLSQATKGGYLKIDWEIGGNPLQNANNLLLEKNIPWTINQLQLLEEQLDDAKLIKSQQRLFLKKTIVKSIAYLEDYQKLLKDMVHFKSGPKELILELKSKRLTENFKVIFNHETGSYRVIPPLIKDEPSVLASEDQIRRLVHSKMQMVFSEIEAEIGDPFQGLNWPN